MARARVAILIVLYFFCFGAPCVNVDDYGAAGDGISWDHRSIRAAINAAGIGGIVEFTPGKTYVCCADVRPLADQVLVGNGATIKRCDSVNTELLHDVSAGSQILVVSNPTVFEIGQSLTPVKGEGGYADGEYATNHFLKSVNGSEISISRALRQDYPAGSIVTVKFAQLAISTSSTGVLIDGLVFDGNRENNNVYLSWTDNQAIVGYSGLIVRNSTFKNLPGNAITAFGTNVLISDNQFHNLDGPIVHLSGNWPENQSSVTIARNLVSNTNRQAARMMHSEGVITVSRYNYSIDILDNVVDKAPVPFISRFHEEMSGWLVKANRVSGTNGIFFAWVDPGEPLSDIFFEGNIFSDVGESQTVRSANGDFIERFNFVNNQVIGGSLRLDGLRDSEVTDNTIQSCDSEPITITGSSNVTVERNDTSVKHCSAGPPSTNSGSQFDLLSICFLLTCLWLRRSLEFRGSESA